MKIKKLFAMLLVTLSVISYPGITHIQAASDSDSELKAKAAENFNKLQKINLLKPSFTNSVPADKTYVELDPDKRKGTSLKEDLVTLGVIAYGAAHIPLPELFVLDAAIAGSCILSSCGGNKSTNPIPPVVEAIPPVACYNGVRSTIGSTNATILCAATDVSGGPIACYNSAVGDTYSLTTANASVLCSGDTSLTPIDCYGETPTSLNEADSAMLCSGAISATTPVDCYFETPIDLSQFDSAVLCSGSISKTAPMDCFDAASVAISTPDASVLCSAAIDYAPIDCFNATPEDLSIENSALLCAGAASLAPMDCYNATPDSLGYTESALLCSGATSTAPMDVCFNKTPGDMAAFEKATLCSEKGQFASLFSGAMALAKSGSGLGKATSSAAISKPAISKANAGLFGTRRTKASTGGSILRKSGH
ncbi:MAG: hypothetical protein HY400_07135 [Elusimicrobia bacterium]|nr:hypothetical protein [Elusimicrobiota bacterium]